MSSRRDKGKGKSTAPDVETSDSGPQQPTTDWSDWQWDIRGYWYSSRIDSNGITEWAYKYPDNVPRSGAFADSSAVESTSTDTHRDSVSSQDSSGYTLDGSTATLVPVKGQGQSSFPQSLQFISNQWPSQTGNSTQGYGHVPGYPSVAISKGYPGCNAPQNSGPAGSSKDNVTFGLQNLGIHPSISTSGASVRVGGAPQASDPKLIRREPGSEDREPLDNRYRLVTAKQSKKFWKPGRVFMMLWTEPAGERVGRQGGTQNNSHISTVMHGQDVFSEIRRFVVVQDNYGSCICLAIHTYSGRATLKRNLPNPQRHAIIYTSKVEPRLHRELQPDNSWIYEQLLIDPIKVNGAREYAEGNLGDRSRLDFTKPYNVEKDVRVLNVGVVSDASMSALERHSPVKVWSMNDAVGENPQTSSSSQRPARSWAPPSTQTDSRTVQSTSWWPASTTQTPLNIPRPASLWPTAANPTDLSIIPAADSTDPVPAAKSSFNEDEAASQPKEIRHRRDSSSHPPKSPSGGGHRRKHRR